MLANYATAQLENLLGDDSVAMILGDNIYYGNGMRKMLQRASSKQQGGTVFGYHVQDPERFGVVEFSEEGKVLSVEEKPTQPKSNYAITGLYFYDNRVIEIAKNVEVSSRGELEITSINEAYLNLGELDVELLGRGFTWLDTGTHQSLVDATNFTESVAAMKIIETLLKGVLVVEPAVFGDHRGWFMETYSGAKFKEHGIDMDFVQDNQSYSATKGTLRVLHYQLHPKAQTKLVRCTRGAIFDVAVDIRKGSPNYSKWFCIELNAENKKQLLIPKGFAHGFMTLTEDVEFSISAMSFMPRNVMGVFCGMILLLALNGLFMLHQCCLPRMRTHLY